MHHSDSESDTELTQLMNNVVRRSKAFDPAQVVLSFVAVSVVQISVHFVLNL